MENCCNEAPFAVLREFLALPHNANAVLEKFAALPNAVRKTGGPKEGFVYIPGTRENAVLLVAHADTRYDKEQPVELIEDEDTFRNSNDLLGGDDRAGCAVCRLMLNSGHGILITDGEEGGAFGSEFLKRVHPEIFSEINQKYQFMIQIDRCGTGEFKCYNVGSEAFRSYVAEKTGFSEPDRLRSTDVVHLCRDICGVNLACGYYKEHTDEEYLVKKEWLHTLELLKVWLADENLPKFVLDEN